MRLLSLFLRLLLGFTLAAPIVCQSESQPYFSLSTDRTFGSAETPAISLAGTHLAAVQIRVYRVKDPLEFYRKIESPHNFGAQEQQQINKHSFLGSVRIWKHDLRRRIRLFLRGQFTESVSAHFRPARSKREQAAVKSNENYFATTPVLNRDQLVLSFVQPLSKQNWSSVSVPIRVNEKGVYLVEAVAGGLRAYTIVIKSDLVLVTKVGRQKIVGFVADRRSGEPVAGAKLQVMMRNGTPTAVVTNTDGLADINAGSATGGGNNELRVVASTENDLTLNALSLWNYGAAARQWTGYIYTDRPVYRPRDTVHFRGILRIQNSPTGYSIPAGQSFAVQIQDPDGKQVYAKHLTANSNGIIHDEFTSDRTAALGNYYIQVAGGEIPMTGNFEIQDYKKPEYEVRVTTAKPRVLEGDTLDALINAKYYFGEPVKNARVEYSVYRTRYFYPLWQDADEGAAEAAVDNPTNDEDAGEEVLRAQGQLDSDGNLTVHYRTTVSDRGHDYKYRIEARVTDEARREISGTGWAVATYGTFLVSVEPQRYFYQPSGQAELSLKAVDYDGKPVSVPVKIELLRRKPRQENPEIVKTTGASTGADGTGSATVPLPAEGGSYEIRVSAISGNGRTVTNTAYLWVAGSGESGFFEGGNAHSVQIVPDKKKYAAGETAKLLIICGQPNTPVLVTVEERDVRVAKVLRSTGPTVAFDYKVSAEDQPGVFVSAQFVRKGEMYQGQKRLIVPPVAHKLDVQITTGKSTYLPGQTAMYQLNVKTPEGKPVAGADLSLGVVDEAIYAIRPDTTPDLLAFFYGNEGDNVNTLDSLTYYFNGEAGNRRMLLAMATAARNPLAQIKPEPLVQPKIRKAFPDTSYWAADLTTDQSGSVQTKVTFPDSLTTWRATAKGVTASDRFGAAVMKTIVRKNIILRLAIPRFFVQGDETVISGIVHNYLPNSKHAKVSVSLTGLELIGSNGTVDVDVPSRGDAKVDWRVKTKIATEAKITGNALTDQESDAVEMSVPVKPQGVSIHQSKGGTVTAGGTANHQITFPADAESGSRSLSIRLSSSVAGSIFQALDFLTSFPYGCVEQTMSSFLPNLMVTRAMRSVSGVPKVDEVRLQEQVKSGLDRLYGMQHDDGGWGWWTSDQSQPFMTAYVVNGLAEAKREDVAVREDRAAERYCVAAREGGERLRTRAGYASLFGVRAGVGRSVRFGPRRKNL